jgi:adenine-specific DNA-methyltransferase
MPNLNWDSRNAAVHAHTQTPYHLLQHAGNYGAPPAQGGKASSEAQNLLIQGDNLQALKALLPFYTGRVKCVFIDPPYNTGSAFTHYDDKLQHSVWLSMMLPRIKLLHQLLAQDGSLWVTIDDNEAHYLKVMLDEVFGRENFVANVVWNHRKSVQSDTVISLSHNHVFLYAKNKQNINLNRLEVTAEKFDNPDNDPRGAWSATPFDAPNIRPNLTYEIKNPNTGESYWPPKGRHWRTTQDEYFRLLSENQIVFGKKGLTKPQQKMFQEFAQAKGGSIKTWWDDAGTATEATKELQKVSVEFDTPKPERLLQKILHIATNPNDLVLDSFLGSGTTAAVAHKMGRRWIGIEMGAHAATHCIPRLEKVIAGEQGGISSAVGWAGGGGFAHYTLGEPVFMANRHINPQVKFAALAAFVWHRETQQAANTTHTAPLLGVHEGTAYYLLYNGILRDRSVDGGNVLTRSLWDWLQTHHAPSEVVTRYVVYGEISKLAAPLCAKLGIVFKQMPYRLQDA